MHQSVRNYYLDFTATHEIEGVQFRDDPGGAVTELDVQVAPNRILTVSSRELATEPQERGAVPYATPWARTEHEVTLLGSVRRTRRTRYGSTSKSSGPRQKEISAG